MVDFLFLVFTYVSEALIVFLYAKALYNEKLKNSYTLLITVGTYLLLMLIYKFIINNEFVNMFIILSANFLLLYFLYHSSLKSVLFHSIVLLVLQLASEFLTAYIIALVLNITSQEVITEHFESGVVISRIIYLLLTSIVAKLSTRETRSNTWGKWYALSLLPISSVIIIAVFKAITDGLQLNHAQNIVSIFSISFVLIVNIIVYWIYEQAEKNSQKLIELELTSQKNEIDLQYLNLLEKKNEDMQIMAHDYKNHIQAIQSMDNISDIHKYLSELKGEVVNLSKIAQTKNSILDVILSKYSDICKEKSIDFRINTITDNFEFMAINDTSALFNNLLDNAVEAAEPSNEKYIDLQISNALGSYHKIVLINSSDKSPNSDRGKLITSKKNKQLHGFGTKSIERIIDKYKGELQWNYYHDKKEFEIVIVIPINQ
ncbi:MAG: GHKL domain-containing protein [Eubacterium sp.]|nr:GHKL domain-containing protein [Eubacterium sp.]